MDILIVEDEFLAVQKLMKLLSLSEYSADVIGVTDGIESTVEWLQTHPQPDLILMDIELADGQSFEIFNLVTITCPVIFTTSYDESAIKSFRGNSLHYLLKPIKKDELEQALHKFQQASVVRHVTAIDIGLLIDDLKKQNWQETVRSQFLVNHDQQMIPIDTADIAYFYTRGNATYLCGKNKTSYLIEYGLNDLENLLDPAFFFRLNDEFLVQPMAVSRIHHSLNGRLKIDLNPEIEHEVLVNRDRASEFTEWLSR
ncbi:response regulator transcription factor [Spirosoma aureum]|uniref:Response regulator transcription factor n=1 Tax=Spirosoma aureum TaxID=2692134 RepID=A0A6G9AI83_9BACT|nr:LytTR family DNA-binding domain-containing protein [Spirosoma aureum]QIP12182.1 response regulator transcription factor [Spirosoma aureum]